MRTSRIKISPREEEAVYHCISRTTGGERLLDDLEREMFRRQMWQIADFCGVQILTYAILSNHFHILALVPRATAISDAELLRRHKVLYPQPTKYQTARLDTLEKKLAAGAEDMRVWRQRQLAMMGDISQFMKLLKQRFTIWFNHHHQRYGTLWAERFKSVLVENSDVLRVVAAYIDLNPVRAGLAADPKDYRFCGYAEAVAGNAQARATLTLTMAANDWTSAQRTYRQILYGAGGKTKPNAASLSAARVNQVLKEQGALSVAELLRCRVRYFTDGAVLGGKNIVARQLAKSRAKPTRNTEPHPLPVITGCPPLAIMHSLRRPPLDSSPS